MDNVKMIIDSLSKMMNQTIMVSFASDFGVLEKTGAVSSLSNSPEYIFLKFDNNDGLSIHIDSVTRVYGKGEHEEFTFAYLVIEYNNQSMVFA